MNRTTAAGLLAAGALVAVTVGSGDHVSAASPTPAPSGSSLASTDPASFSRPRTNPYFPLPPGTVSIYRGSDEGKHLRERLAVTHRTRVIQGVTTTVVTDVVRRHDGSVAERTTDWYAADNDGNVWYFGEDTATYTRGGHVDSRDGTWLAGRDGARPGLIMPADPEPTDAYRQEFLRGQAEDQAWIVDNKGHVKVPAGSYRHVVRSYEWTRLEPGVVSLKLYAPVWHRRGARRRRRARGVQAGLGQARSLTVRRPR